MFAYEKRLQFPVKIKNTNPDTARLIMSQYGGPDVIAPLKFLRAREIVHFQRFGEALETTKDSTLC